MKIIQDGREIKIGGNKFTIPSLNHLLALKFHAIKNNPTRREFKDLLDIMLLIDKNKVDVKSHEFRELCLRYGTKELYDRILSFKRKK